jgi:hypothetical protein
MLNFFPDIKGIIHIFMTVETSNLFSTENLFLQIKSMQLILHSSSETFIEAHFSKKTKTLGNQVNLLLW